MKHNLRATKFHRDDVPRNGRAPFADPKFVQVLIPGTWRRGVSNALLLSYPTRTDERVARLSRFAVLQHKRCPQRCETARRPSCARQFGRSHSRRSCRSCNPNPGSLITHRTVCPQGGDMPLRHVRCDESERKAVGANPGPGRRSGSPSARKRLILFNLLAPRLDWRLRSGVGTGPLGPTNQPGPGGQFRVPCHRHAAGLCCGRPAGRP